MEKYERPDVWIIELPAADIICLSFPIEKDDDSNDGDWI